ncbi:helix-turn-helix domain-containing protein [Halorubrum sp. 48-1-W]|uniref:helix-turn-helix domain-containing protein n=1 Tax=Halorubrum sp. 48-1-W TaxID=2249761 RepID=UPI000DCC906C|nr:helix-turn-helix domain-containing protein [Halorubrum sp. 48-1-W]RAW44593.1 helix-turn-helix domain-containing protein [Halorubrum sp. 48-1-W]
MADIQQATSNIRSIALDNAFYIEDGTWFESLTIAAAGELNSTDIADISGIELFDEQEVPSGPTDVNIRRYTVLATEPYPFILGVVLRQEAIPNRIVLQNGRFEVVVTVREWEVVQLLAEQIGEQFGTFDLESVTEVDRSGEPLDSGRLSEVLVSKLTDDQLVVLETAYELGYFEVPREATASDIADALDIADSTVSERLRVAQRNLFELIYGARSADGVNELGEM